MNLEAATGAVVTVGDGRGFVVEGSKDRLVIAAAHCWASPSAVVFALNGLSPHFPGNRFS